VTPDQGKKEERSWLTTLKAFFTKGSDLREIAPDVVVKYGDMLDEAVKAAGDHEEKQRSEKKPARPKPAD
jgi:hypothetical protein